MSIKKVLYLNYVSWNYLKSFLIVSCFNLSHLTNSLFFYFTIDFSMKLFIILILSSLIQVIKFLNYLFLLIYLNTFFKQLLLDLINIIYPILMIRFKKLTLMRFNLYFLNYLYKINQFTC